MLRGGERKKIQMLQLLTLHEEGRKFFGGEKKKGTRGGEDGLNWCLLGSDSIRPI